LILNFFPCVSFDTVYQQLREVHYIVNTDNEQKPKIMKTLHCSDAGINCEAVIHAATIGEVLKQAAVHAKEAHGVSVTRELMLII